LSVVSTLTPELRPWALALYDVALEYGGQPSWLSGFRSIRQQSALYARWTSGRSSIPAAPPGRSLHNYGHAFDLRTRDADFQQWLGEVWEHWGGRWGGRFNDPNHFDTGATIS